MQIYEKVSRKISLIHRNLSDVYFVWLHKSQRLMMCTTLNPMDQGWGLSEYCIQKIHFLPDITRSHDIDSPNDHEISCCSICVQIG
jgi:hypothetical protein